MTWPELWFIAASLAIYTLGLVHAARAILGLHRPHNAVPPHWRRHARHAFRRHRPTRLGETDARL
jgi:hypothetical protein